MEKLLELKKFLQEKLDECPDDSTVYERGLEDAYTNIMKEIDKLLN
jgi:hypothetical protein